ncbi:hypothetical protein HPB48_002784 [Haemaphysalis longicornis]|uniref:Uncharacterized protein n=1 Tax=Haemaphysalis longicornis TaxID=44386 RepID=A0A9J6GMT8_HAELO|nr:hypothetical protein HPB48_002784 [Haemaphysalis longicornis]
MPRILQQIFADDRQSKEASVAESRVDESKAPESEGRQTLGGITRETTRREARCGKLYELSKRRKAPQRRGIDEAAVVSETSTLIGHVDEQRRRRSGRLRDKGHDRARVEEGESHQRSGFPAPFGRILLFPEESGAIFPPSGPSVRPLSKRQGTPPILECRRMRRRREVRRPLRRALKVFSM